MTIRASRCSWALVLCLVGCAEAPEPAASRQIRIVGGEVSGPDDDAVVYMISRLPRPFAPIACNGVLIAPNLLLTALQCVSVFRADGKFECNQDGSLAPPDFGFGWIGETVEPPNVEIYLGAKPSRSPDAYGEHVLGTGSTQVCSGDIAVVVLDRDLPIAGLPVRLDAAVMPEEHMTLIGYGWSDMEADESRWRRRGVPVLDSRPVNGSEDSGWTLPGTFLVGDGPCMGDSGGPALSDETGAVSGVFSLTFGGDCLQSGTRNVYTEVASYSSLIREGFERAGREPVPTRAEPTRAGTSADASCSFAHTPRRSPFGAVGGLLASAILWAWRRKRACSASRCG